MALDSALPVLLRNASRAAEAKQQQTEKRQPLLDPHASSAAPAQSQVLTGMDHVMAIPSLDAQVRNEKEMCPILVFGKLYFSEALDVKRVRSTLRERLLRFPRFCSLAVANAGRYEMRSLARDHVDMNRMVIEASDDVKTQADLDKFCSSLSEAPLPVDRPLWRAYVINDMEDGRSLLLWQIDHLLGDGEALIKILLSILDEKYESKQPEKRERKMEPSCFSCLYSVYLTAGALFNVTIGDQLPGDPDNKLKLKNHRAPGSSRSYISSDSLSLDEIRHLKKVLPGSTVNDVLLTVATLALRAYLAKHDPETLAKKQQVRANFPISLRSPCDNQEPDKLGGNAFSTGFFRFPLEESDPLKVLEKVMSQTNKAKLSPEPILRDKMLSLLVSLPVSRKTIGNLALDAFGKVTGTLSNVVGPSTQVHFAGQSVEDIAFNAFAPLGLYLGFVSYRGKVSCTISVHSDNEPTPANLSKLWLHSFQKLQAAAAANAAAMEREREMRTRDDDGLATSLRCLGFRVVDERAVLPLTGV